ncbi:MAG TPA: hypothetical protein VI111_02945, partial [Thermoleophilaceae bacterium]
SGQVEDWDPQLSDTFGRCGGGTGGVRSLALAGGRIWAGGEFEVANVRPRAGLAAFDVASDSPTDWAPQVNAPNSSGQSGVRDLLLSPDGTSVYLAGQFTNLNGVPRLNAAAVAATGDASDPADVTAWEPAPNGRVNALAFAPSGGRVYVGGDFTKLGTAPRSRLGWVSPATGAASGWMPKPDGRVSDIAVADDGSVFAAGAFAHAGAQAVEPERHGLALLAPDTAQATAWDAGAPAGTEVDSLALAGGLLYLGGKLNGSVGGQPRVGAAALDQGSALATPWDPQVAGGSARVLRVTPAADGTVYLLGSFSSVGGVSHSGAASVAADGTVTKWGPPGVAPGPSPPPVQFVGDSLILGGAFTNAGGRLQAGFGIFGPATAPGAATAPVVRFSGPLRVGSQLTCQPGVFDGSWPFALAYQWLRDGEPIAGETRTTYVSTLGDAAHELSCRELASNAAGDADQVSVAIVVLPEPPALELPPAVGGEAWVGGEAHCSTGLWRNAPASYAYRWLLDGSVVAGATARSLALAVGDLGRALACEVTAENAAGATVARSAPVTVGVAPPLNLSSPLAAGEARVGTELSCDPGTWIGAAGYAFAWLRDGVAIPGASGAQLRLTSRDRGRAVGCRVTANGPGGVRSADSAARTVQALPHQAGSRVRARADEPSRPVGLDLRRARLQRDGSLRLEI